MDKETRRQRLCGCYVTIPTMFRDNDLELNLPGMRKHVQFLLKGGLKTGNAVLLAGGAAGDFSTMTFDERVKVAGTVVEEAGGKIPIIMGAQTTNTRELVALAKAAERVGAEYIQVSPPYYFSATQDDFYEYVLAAAEAADVGIILYNTYWTTGSISLGMVEKLVTLPNLVGLKWAAPSGFMPFEQMVIRFANRLSIIDNQLKFVTSHMIGTRGIEVHPCNYWPQWGVRLWNLLEDHKYIEAQQELIKVIMPFYLLWEETERFTGGDGYVDKLCMELVGLPSSRSRPPTRDIRPLFREKARKMLLECGVPGVVPA